MDKDRTYKAIEYAYITVFFIIQIFYMITIFLQNPNNTEYLIMNLGPIFALILIYIDESRDRKAKARHYENVEKKSLAIMISKIILSIIAKFKIDDLERCEANVVDNETQGS